MRTSSISYPYPVIGNENDVEGRFMVTKFQRTSEPDTITLEYKFEVTNDTLRQFIEDGKAIFSMQIECSTTFFRYIFTSDKYSGTIQIPSIRLRERVIVRFYVCANQDIPDYLPSGSHPDYAGVGFEIEKADVLAVAGYTSFNAEKTFDPLNAPLDSLFRIRQGDQKGRIEAEFDQDKIVIVIPKEDFKPYTDVLNRKLFDNIHATVVYPVLVEALNHMKSSPSDFESYTWFERIMDICIQRQYDITDPLITAQQILGNPVGRSFLQLDKELDKYEDDGEL
jgi:hypothetical protein